MKELDLTRQPPGVVFRPPPEVLIQDYLSPKINGSDQGAIDFIHVVTFFKQDPWELLGLTGIKTREPDDHYFFFSEPDAKYRNGNRVNRKTDTGYWKVTGKDYKIWSEGRLIGKRKILVFHLGNSPNGDKNDWVVHEYHATELDGNNPRQKAFVLCHLFWKSNKGNPSKSEEETDNHVTGCYPTKTNNCRKGRKGNSSEAGPSKSKQARASISPASGDEADNHVTGYCPDRPVAGGDNNVNSSAAENQVTDIEIGDSNMLCVLPSSNVFDVPPELLGFSPLHLQMQPACMPDCVANDSNYVGDDLSCQYGTNVPAAFTSNLWGPQPPYSDEFLHNDSSNQRTSLQAR